MPGVLGGHANRYNCRVDTDERQRLSDAFAFALEVHGDQRRKGIDVPYSSHLLQVAGLVQEHGGDLEQTMAALLHDSVEDVDHVSYELILERFGRDVADIVRDCTDTLPGEKRAAKRAWRTRKVEHLEQLKSAPSRSVLVAVCDKCHNLGATLMDLRDQGPGYLERFNSTPDEQLWYVEAVLEISRDRIPRRLVLEMEVLVAQFRAAIAPGA